MGDQRREGLGRVIFTQRTVVNCWGERAAIYLMAGRRFQWKGPNNWGCRWVWLALPTLPRPTLGSRGGFPGPGCQLGAFLKSAPPSERERIMRFLQKCLLYEVKLSKQADFNYLNAAILPENYYPQLVQHFFSIFLFLTKHPGPPWLQYPPCKILLHWQKQPFA